MRPESQDSIVEWVGQAFGGGPKPTLARCATRANEEMAELLKEVTSGRTDVDKVMEEAADVVIILYRFAHLCGRDLHDAIDAKMRINRAREWQRDGTGHAYHVKSGASPGDEP